MGSGGGAVIDQLTDTYVCTWEHITHKTLTGTQVCVSMCVSTWERRTPPWPEKGEAEVQKTSSLSCSSPM